MTAEAIACGDGLDSSDFSDRCYSSDLAGINTIAVGVEDATSEIVLAQIIGDIFLGV
jgi:hypothetical protein